MEPTGFDNDGSGLDRRAVLRRGAVLGGAMVWTVPAVQTIAGPAFAAGSPRCDAVFSGRIGQRCVTFRFNPSEACCSCIADSRQPLPFAIALCSSWRRCLPAGPPTYDC